MCQFCIQRTTENTAYASVCLIEQSRCERSDKCHDEEHTGHASGLRVKLLLLSPNGTTAHTDAWHKKYTGEQAAHDRTLNEMPLLLGEGDGIEDDFDD